MNEFMVKYGDFSSEKQALELVEAKLKEVMIAEATGADYTVALGQFHGMIEDFIKVKAHRVVQ